MKRTLAVLALAIAPLALAQEGGSGASDWMKKAAGSESGQNAKAKAMAKIGMDITPSPAGARAYIIEPKNGAEVKGPVKVVFGLAGMGVAPAGVQKADTGHHHLLIDGPTVDTAQPLPAKTEQVVHFGNGQTETTVTLKPGKHTLQLMLGDWKHQPHSPAVASEIVTITVK